MVSLETLVDGPNESPPKIVGQIPESDRKNQAYKSKKRDILSFDGGGSRGIMEVSILNDVMRLATIIWRNPQELSYLAGDIDVSKDRKIRQQLIQELSVVPNPLHPNKIYDMIVGTSTGAFIAFGLVGGNSDENGKRLPMSLEECIKMYKDKTKDIFKKSWSHWFLSGIPGLGSIPITTYSQDNVKKVLEDQFQDCCLDDFAGHNGEDKTVAGAVARQVGQNEELVLFDTKSDAYKLYKTYQVLQASADAPVYFQTPVKIGDKEFVDGGVGGNCPLEQAIPRAKEIFGAKNKITSALSIAPPPSEESHIPNSLQVKYWLNYFVEMSTNGHAVYTAVRQRNKKNISFRRLSPRGDSLKRFKLDETDAEKMLDAMEDEKLNNDMFLVDIIATAVVVVNTYLDKTTHPSTLPDSTIEIGATLAEKAGKNYENKSEYELAFCSYTTSIEMWEKSPSEHAKAAIIKIHDDVAAVLTKLGRYPEAADLYRKNIEHWKEQSNNAKIVNAKFGLAECLLLSSFHDEARKEFESVQKMFGADTPKSEIARLLNRFGWWHREVGDYELAVNFFRESYDMRKKLHQDHGVDKGHGDDRDHGDDKDHGKDKDHGEEKDHDKDKAHGKDKDQGEDKDYEDGKDHDEGKDHRDIAETLNSLGLAFSELGWHDKAIKSARCSLDMRKRLIGEEGAHLLIAESMNDLGYCLMGNEDYETAQKNLKESLKMKKAHYRGVDHPSVAITLENYAKCLMHIGKHDNALQHAQQALQMKKNCLGDVNNPAIAKSLEIVGLCVEKAGNRLEDATKYLKESMQMAKHTLHSTHPTFIRILYSVGRLLVKREKFKEADTYLTQARKIENEWRKSQVKHIDL